MKITNILNPNNTLSVNRPLAHAIGVNAAIVFASLIAKQVYYEENQMLDESGFFYSTIEDLEESTALSRAQQDRVLSVLVKKGLIEFHVKGTPPRRFFRLVDDETALANLLDIGGSICKKATNQFAENSQINLQESDKSICKNVENQFAKNLQINLSKNANPIYKTKVNQSKENQSKEIQSKVINPKSSIILPQKTKEMTDLTEELTEGMTEGMNDFHEENSFENERSEREEYLDTIHENIDYDSFSQKEKADEVVGVMLDVMCSQKGTVRVNGEELPAEQVKKRFLELKKAHIEHVLGTLESNAGNVRNIRAYLITALYNAPTAVYSARSSPNNASPNSSYSSNNSARSASAPEKRSRGMESSFDADEVLASIKERYKRPKEEDALYNDSVNW